MSSRSEPASLNAGGVRRPVAPTRPADADAAAAG